MSKFKMLLRFLMIFVLFFTVPDHCLGHSDEDDILDWKYLDKPVQLVKPDEKHKRLILLEENAKLLYKLPGAVATVAVVGKFHSGKSFLMNQLMKKSSGFGIGPTVKPETMGIWMWGKPLRITMPSGEPLSVIFLDTEGFAANNISETYDAKIFAVATLLSSYLIYNSVKIIDQSDIDYLEVLARRTQLFALRSQMSKAKWTDDFNHDLLSFPPLLWVVQDFVQTTGDLNPTQWLRRLMASHSRENEEYEISLLGIFNNIDCHTLFLPATKKQLLIDLSLAGENDLTLEYRAERDAMIEKLFTNLKPKEKNDKPITGAEWVALLHILVNAANEGSLSDVPTRWNSFIKHLQVTATEDCIKFYEAEMIHFQQHFESMPIVPGELEEWHRNVHKKALNLLEHLLYGLLDAIDKSRLELSSAIEHRFQKSMEINEKKIQLKSRDVQGKAMLNAEQKFDEISLPVATPSIQKLILLTTNEAVKSFVAEMYQFISDQDMENYITSLKNSLANAGDSLLLKNNRAIEEHLTLTIRSANERFRDLTKLEDGNPRFPKTLNTMIKSAREDSMRYFMEKAEPFSKEGVFDAFKALLSTNLQEGSKQIHLQNEKLIKDVGTKAVQTLVSNFEEKTSQKYLSLPVQESEMDLALKNEDQIAKNKYEDVMKDFSSYDVYVALKANLKGEIKRIVDKRKQENVEAFTQVVAKPLGTAKKVILLTAEKYTTVFSLKQYMRQVSLLHLDEGRAKTWPLELKVQIANHYIQSDPDLHKTLKSREGWWSTFLGWFQWLLWLFIGGKDT